MKIHLATLLFVALPFSACSQNEPRSQLYFDAHVDEARQIVEGCRDGSVRGEECSNAARAVSKVDAKEKAKRFWGDGKAYTPR